MSENDLQRPQSFAGHTHVFIVCIWLKPREIAGVFVEWRGVIEHLPTQEKRYLTELAAISRFINPYLDSMGVQRGLHVRLRRWLNHMLATLSK